MTRSVRIGDQRTEAAAGTNFGTLVDETVRLRPDSIAIIWGETGTNVSYAEFSALTASAANVLSAHDVTKGDRVALILPNEPTFLYVFFGAIRLGAVPVPVNVEISKGVVRDIVADSGAPVIVTGGSPGLVQTSASVADAHPSVHTLLIDADDPDANADVPTRSLPRSMAEASTEYDPSPVTGDDPAYQLYTSGSTGRPKGVVHTHAGSWWLTTVNRNVQFIDETDRSVCPAPLYHKNTLVGAVKPLLAAGGSVVLLDGFVAADVIAAIDEYDATCLRGVPAMFRLLLDETDVLADHDVSSLTWAVSGAGPLPTSVAERFRDWFGAPLGQSYGMTECGPILLTPRWGPSNPERKGLPLPGVSTRIVDPESGQRREPGRSGELLVSSPGVGRYHGRSGTSGSPVELIDGRRFLHTGDLARMDEDGYYRIIGRLDDALLVGGEKVHPASVEERLERHPKVLEAAVVGVPHAVKNEAPVAFLVCSGRVSEEELRSYAIEHGPTYAHPRRIFFEDELPMASTGKVDRNALTDSARSRIGGSL